MAVCYFTITILIIVLHIHLLPSIFSRIIHEAFGLRQVAAGGFGAVLMNGIKRGLFSNEAGSGSAPCAAAAAECDQPVKAGLVQALGVFIDTIVICSCTAMIMLLAPEKLVKGLQGMDLLQAAMKYHLGDFGVIFIAATLFLFSLSTFLGILFYARSNVSYLFGDKWIWQTAYKVLALIMLFIGGLAAYTFVWDLGDVGIGLMTIFNVIILYPLGGKALNEFKTVRKRKERKKELKKCKACALHYKNCNSNSCWYTTTVRAISQSIKSAKPALCQKFNVPLNFARIAIAILVGVPLLYKQFPIFSDGIFYGYIVRLSTSLSWSMHRSFCSPAEAMRWIHFYSTDSSKNS